MLSPSIFNLYIADIENYLNNKGIRGVSINHLTEILLLAYADDIAIMADNIVNMIKILRHPFEYTKENNLAVNIDKMKVVIFQKGGHGHNKVFYYFLW